MIMINRRYSKYHKNTRINNHQDLTARDRMRIVLNNKNCLLASQEKVQ
jgi:hypothetical protein